MFSAENFLWFSLFVIENLVLEIIPFGLNYWELKFINLLDIVNRYDVAKDGSIADVFISSCTFGYDL